jgi:hypothetical protein
MVRPWRALWGEAFGEALVRLVITAGAPVACAFRCLFGFVIVRISFTGP